MSACGVSASLAAGVVCALTWELGVQLSSKQLFGFNIRPALTVGNTSAI